MIVKIVKIDIDFVADADVIADADAEADVDDNDNFLMQGLPAAL